MKEFFKDSRNIILSACAILAILIIVIIFVLIRNNNPKIAKEKIENEIKVMASDFYENFYYDAITKDLGINQIKVFEREGIIADLNILSRYKGEYKEKIENFKHPKKEEKCQKEFTKAIIYPKDPYNKGDYEIKVELSCGFDE